MIVFSTPRGDGSPRAKRTKPFGLSGRYQHEDNKYILVFFLCRDSNLQFPFSKLPTSNLWQGGDFVL